MNKKEYKEALKSPEWVKKRDFIKKRDNYCCTICECKKELHVHHTYYLRGKMPWEVPDSCLITLCKDCHKKEHESRNISTFIKTNVDKRKNKITKGKSKKKVKKKIQDSLSKKDRELQDKYDVLKNKLPSSTYTPLVYKQWTKKNKRKKQ
jgi:hypothetical protein